MTSLLGIDVGGSFLKLAHLDGGSLRFERLPVRQDDLLGQLIEVVGHHAGRVEAVGVGMAGLVRWPEGEFVWGPHLRGAAIPVRAALAGRFRIPVVVDNDANAAAFGELTAGAARGARNALVITLGTGIGAGLILEGSVFRGRAFAGEAGHVQVDPDGEPCPCGKRGCWETLVSGRRLDREARVLAAAGGTVGQLAGDDTASASLVVEAARRGDAAARQVLAEAGRWLGVGIANLVAVLDPERVVVAGAVSAAGDHLIEPARWALAARLPAVDVRGVPSLVVSPHAGFSGAVGAAHLAKSASTRAF